MGVLFESVNGSYQRALFGPKSFGLVPELRLITGDRPQSELALQFFGPLINQRGNCQHQKSAYQPAREIFL